MKRIRIAVVTPVFPTSAEPYRGIYCYNTVRAVMKHAEVDIYCTLPTYPQRSAFWPKSFRYRSVDTAFQPEGIPTSYVRYPVFPVLSRPLNGWLCKRALQKCVIPNRPDVILAFWVYPEGFAGVEIGKTLGVPVIIRALGSDLRRIPDSISRYLSRYALKNASQVITVSEDLRRMAVALGSAPERTHKVINGCDLSMFRPGDRASARRQLAIDARSSLIAFVGWLAPLKGLRELLAAVAAVAQQRPDLRLVCIGEGELAGEIAARAAQPDLAGHVLLPGACTAAEIARWLAASDVFCLPSHSEGCPNVILEALACGRPVVASDVGGIPELVDARSGILVPPQNAGALAQALLEALSRSWDEHTIAGLRARSWEDVGQEVFGLCAAAVDEARGCRSAKREMSICELQ